MQGAEELGAILREKFDNAPRKGQSIPFYLFAIEHYSDVNRVGIRQIVEAAGLKPSWKTELSKAMSLAPYVRIL